MSALTLFRRIILPGMVPYAMPGLSNLWLIATKDTALLAVVGFSELTLATRQAAGATKDYLFFFFVAGALYLGLTLLSSIGLRHSRSQDATLDAELSMTDLGPEIVAREIGDEILAPPRRSIRIPPHRIVLGLVGAALVFGAAIFLRWDWLPLYIGRIVSGVGETVMLLIVTTLLGFVLAVPIGLAQVIGSAPAIDRGPDVLHHHPRHAAAAAALAALLRPGFGLPDGAGHSRERLLALSAAGVALCGRGPHAVVRRL